MDHRNRIVLKEVKVDDFAVKLKISRDKPAEVKFNCEMKRHLEDMKRFSGDDIEISNLIDKDHRVTFIRGVAGMGKSVLAKKLAVGWASAAIYKNFKLCIIFECRDFNYFQSTEGVELKKHEVFDKFLKSKCNFELGDGQGVLFVVDGLDELYDICTSDSVIGQLVNLRFSKYRKSKILITGRPHVQEKLIQHGDSMGSLQTFEIQGLSDDQIEEYISRFSSLPENISAINKSKELSKGSLPILSVPQFLNTFCCVAILMKGEEIRSSAELYLWTVYLLLKQHDADKPHLSNKTISEIFNAYSKSLMTISKVCHSLLDENKIIFEGETALLLCETEKGKNFIESLFFDVSDNFSKKFQFKHLSLVEFLAALHICCNSKNLIDHIKENLKRGFTEVVYFTCSLMAGFSSEGIIREMLKNVVELKAFDEKLFLMNVLTTLDESKLDYETIFKGSITIISCFLNKKFNDSTFFLKVVEQLRFMGPLDAVGSSIIATICLHLDEVCMCKVDKFRRAFRNVAISEFKVNKLNDLSFLKYLNFSKKIRDIYIEDTKTNVEDLSLKLKETKVFENCETLLVVNCTLDDVEEIQNRRLTFEEALKGLEVVGCKLNFNSFKNICQLGVLCEQFRLRNLDIKNDWWEELALEIEERQINGELKLKLLIIDDCRTKMTKENQMRVRRFTNSNYFNVLIFSTLILLNDAISVVFNNFLV